MTTIKLGVASRERIPLNLETNSGLNETEVKLITPEHAQTGFVNAKTLARFRIQHAEKQNPCVFLEIMPGCDMGSVIMDGKLYHLVEAA